MASFTTDSFPSVHERDSDRRTSWTISHRLGRQNAFIVDPDEPYNPFDSLNIQLSDVSTSSSFSSIHSTVSKTLVEDNHNDTPTKRPQEPFSRPPIPQNTADYDEPQWKIARPRAINASPSRTTQHSFFTWLDSFYFMLKKALWFLAFSVIYQIFSCTELQHMPTERLYAIDPDAPTHVWVPVFQWTCWNHAWVGKCPTSALWILGATIGLACLHWKRR